MTSHSEKKHTMRSLLMYKMEKTGNTEVDTGATYTIPLQTHPGYNYKAKMILTHAYRLTRSWVFDPLVVLFTALLQSALLFTIGTRPDVDEKKDHDLFPTSSHFLKFVDSEKTSGVSETSEMPGQVDNAKPCSTSAMSMFVPTKNAAGEFEFKLSNGNEEHDIPYTGKDQIATEEKTDMNKNNSNKAVVNNGFINLSPVSSAKSTDSNSSLNINTTNGESGDSEGNESSDGTDRTYQCTHCDSKFKCKSYLTRHIKKHSEKKAYKCPFYKETDRKCHQNGGFSRRDTFKTHLKSRHFEYPPGVKSTKRTGMMGWCGICGEKFLNNEIWVERHIELGICPGLPEEYIRTLKIGKKKTGKHSKFLDVRNIDESLKLGVQGQTNKSGSTYLQSPSSMNSSPSSNGLMNNNIPQSVNQNSIFSTSSTPTVTTTTDNNSRLPIYPAVDMETLELLQKQEELSRIINALKLKQEEAESRTEAAKRQYEQQMQNQLHFQMKQMQLQQQLLQLQQMHASPPTMFSSSQLHLQQLQQLHLQQQQQQQQQLQHPPQPQPQPQPQLHHQHQLQQMQHLEQQAESDDEYPSLE